MIMLFLPPHPCSLSTHLLVGNEGGLYMEREARVLTGIVEHLLPRVGVSVLSLDLAHGKAVSNTVVSTHIEHTYTPLHVYTCTAVYVV